MLVLGVRIGARLVQNQYWGIFQDCPCNRNTLLLSAGQIYAAVTDFCLVALDSVYMRLSQNSQPNSDTPDMNSRKER